jgi:hypothetical protein
VAGAFTYFTADIRPWVMIGNVGEDRVFCCLVERFFLRTVGWFEVCPNIDALSRLNSNGEELNNSCVTDWRDTGSIACILRAHFLDFVDLVFGSLEVKVRAGCEKHSHIFTADEFLFLPPAGSSDNP